MRFAVRFIVTIFVAVVGIVQAQSLLNSPAYLASWRQILSNSSTATWSPSGSQIAYDQDQLSGGQAGYWQVSTMNADGSGNSCFTCTGAANVGVLQQVFSVTTGTGGSLANSGTWTTASPTTPCTGSGATGTYTASSGNLTALAITSGGTSYNCPPTLVFSGGGSLGTSTYYLPALPGLNYGNPIWSRTGAFIVFQAQCGPSLGSPSLDGPGFPGSGWNNDLWAWSTSTSKFWQLTNQCGGNIGTGTGGVIYPTFSWGNGLLAWGQRLALTCSGEGSFYGKWQLEIQSWSEAGGVPSITNNVSGNPFAPGTNQCYYEPHAFDQSDAYVFLMGNEEFGMQPDAMNIYAYQFSANTFSNLTGNLDQWSEWPTTLPSGTFYGNRLVYVTTVGTNWSGADVVHPAFQLEMWSMNYDGSNKQRITNFNTPGNADYMNFGLAPSGGNYGICLCAPSWNPYTNQFLVNNNQQCAFGASNLGGRTPGQMWLLDIGVVSSGALSGSGFFPGSGLR
jgi:hypothetical protein